MFINNFGNLIYECADVSKQDINKLPCNIFMSESEGNYGPRIKFQYNHKDEYLEDEMSIMTIEDNPKITGTIGNLSQCDIEYLKSFVIRNKDVLMDYWNLNIDIETLF